MQDLQEVTQDLHYENFRSERLKKAGRSEAVLRCLNLTVAVFFFFFSQMFVCQQSCG